MLRPHTLRLFSVAAAANHVGKIRGRRCRLRRYRFRRCLLRALYDD